MPGLFDTRPVLVFDLYPAGHVPVGETGFLYISIMTIIFAKFGCLKSASVGNLLEKNTLVSYYLLMEGKASPVLVKSRSQAADLHRRIKEGVHFEAVAPDFSICPSTSKGGDFGWFGPGKMVSEFEPECTHSGVRAVRDVVRIQFGYHIIKLTGKESLLSSG